MKSDAVEATPTKPRSELRRLANLQSELSWQHYDLGGEHRDAGSMHCPCELAKKCRAAYDAWEAERVKPTNYRLQSRIYALVNSRDKLVEALEFLEGAVSPNDWNLSGAEEALALAKQEEPQ